MLATQRVSAIGNTNNGMTNTERLEPEVLIRDVTPELLGEIRQEWRDGFDAGIKTGALRIMDSAALQQIASELVLLREVAHRLGVKCDYWRSKSDEFEEQATYWHGVASETRRA